MNFKKINIVSGWIVFAIAYIVYLLTLEPTVSFWDCGEFLSTAFKLEVGHSPGAPLFMLVTRLFGAVAPNLGKAAVFMNSVSALASGLTILFLFWSITYFAKKIVLKTTNEANFTAAQTLSIIGAGVVGALAYTFSDTFWFSAVEGEVYATSSFFTAISFWAILKWEENADAPHADRWIVLIAYLMGLSVGVHLLNLLTIPSIVLVYYFKRFKFTPAGTVIAIMVGCAILGFAQFGVIQYLPLIATKFEYLFVNSFGMPFNSGAYFFIALLIVIIAVLLIYAHKKRLYNLHLAILSIAFIILGYSSYVAVVIRANADLPINMTNPNTVMTLLPYLQRDQYGQQPLVYGPDFNSKVTAVNKGRDVYAPVTVDGKDVYIHADNKLSYDFDHERLFPRVWDFNDPNHGRFYMNYLGLSEGEDVTGGDNMKFFMGYQLNWMWWRYFMWNFTGRQNDIEGQGNAQDGNWISGISFVDKILGKGDMSKMPDFYRNNRARNQMYFLPFIIGILGIVYQYKKDKKDFSVALLFFFFTGIAVQLFINNTPLQPRERDYQYITAYVFSIWIGFGVMFLTELFQKKMKGGVGAPALATAICLLLAPILMASQEWDDHDRSQKTLARDHAYNMLATCEPNAILITYGDNDTYPLWYIQEVENFRRDVRIINANLLGTDWQNAELFKKVNDADAVPVIWKPEDCVGNTYNYIPVHMEDKLGDNYFNVEDIIKYFTDSKNRLMSQDGDAVAYLPTNRMFVNVDRNAVLKNHLVAEADVANIPDSIHFVFNKGNATRMDLAMMNIIAGVAKDGWRRPIYVTDGTPMLGLDAYFKREGLVNKFVPARNNSNVQGLQQFTNLDKNYKLFTQTFTLGKANTDKVYYDEPNRRIFIGFRQSAGLLADNLVFANRKADAIKLLDNVMGKISERSAGYEVTPFDKSMLLILEGYSQAGAKAQFVKYADRVVENIRKGIAYMKTTPEPSINMLMQYGYSDVMALNSIASMAQKGLNDPQLTQKYGQQLQDLSNQLFEVMPDLKTSLSQRQQQPQDEEE